MILHYHYKDFLDAMETRPTRNSALRKSPCSSGANLEHHQHLDKDLNRKLDQHADADYESNRELDIEPPPYAMPVYEENQLELPQFMELVAQRGSASYSG